MLGSRTVGLTPAEPPTSGTWPRAAPKALTIASSRMARLSLMSMAKVWGVSRRCWSSSCSASRARAAAKPAAISKSHSRSIGLTDATKCSASKLTPMIEPRRWPSGVISPAVVQPITVASRPYSPTAAATSAMWNCGEQNSMTSSDFTPVKELRMAFTISFGVLPMASSCRAQRMQRCAALGSGASPGAC